LTFEHTAALRLHERDATPLAFGSFLRKAQSDKRGNCHRHQRNAARNQAKEGGGTFHTNSI